MHWPNRPALGRSSADLCGRLNADFVVYGCRNSLNTAEVALRRLDRDMAEKELNLLKFASGRPT